MSVSQTSFKNVYKLEMNRICTF